jgi:uncharacterized circularly permuted ATP-grasp superfamily protein
MYRVGWSSIPDTGAPSVSVIARRRRRHRKEPEQVRGPWFDEVFNEDGTLRRPYAALRRCARRDPLRPAAALAEQLRDRPFDDDTRIFPVPVVIDDTEYRTVVQAGVAQRALALQQLFADLVLGEQQVLTAGVGLDRGLLDEILAAAGTSLARLRGLWQAHGRDAIRFVYGPDLIRDPGGRWVVLEDNLGCVGGSADAFFVADRYRSASGLPGCPACQCQPDLAIAIRRWLHLLGRDPDDRVAALLGCETTGGDPWALRLEENARRRLILDELAIRVIDPVQLGSQETTGGHPTALINFDVDESWSEVFGRPGVAMFNAPGTGVLGAKALLPYVDDLIRFYMRGEPILRTPPTRLLSDGVLPADQENWVVKTSVGRQGTEVFVLRWQPRDRLELVEDLVRKEWSGAAAVAQRYVEPSRLTPAGPGSWDGYRVEIRPVAYVLDWHEVYVSEQSAGKVVSIYDARRLNNISQGACYAPVLRQPCPGCGTGA